MKTQKHGPERRRHWRKLQIGIDAQTLQIRAVGVTSNKVSDASVLPDLLRQLPEDEPLESLTCDGAYETHSQPMKRPSGVVLSQSFLDARMLEFLGEVSLSTAMQRLLHAGG